jgi:hypothetical protein
MLFWQFVLGDDWSSEFIAWYGQGYGGYSHVDAILPDGSLLGARSDSVGGQPPGVRIRPPNYEKWKRRAVVTLQSTDQQAQAWRDFLKSQIGLGYDKADIIGFIIGRPMSTPGHWICSALQMDALEVVKVFPNLPLTPQQCPPNMLMAMLLARGANCQVYPS